jgi:hypothetical protein
LIRSSSFDELIAGIRHDRCGRLVGTVPTGTEEGEKKECS